MKVAVAVAAMAAIGAACAPVAPPPPPAPSPAPKPASKPSPNCFGAAGSGVSERSFVAVVEKPDEETPEVYTFEAATPAEQDAAVEELERIGDVVTVEPDEPVRIAEETEVPPTDATTTSTEPTTTTSVAPATTTTSQPAPTVPEPPASADAPTVSAVTTDDQSYSSQYGLPQSGFDDAWSAGADGDGIVIAVLDTGVQANHPDLSGHVLSGHDFVCGTGGTAVDPHGHGTHVAGIAGARDNTIFGLGGAPESRILPVRVLGSSGSGSTSDVVAGIYWAVDDGGADVINLSLGGGYSSSMLQAVRYAEEAGVVVVAAAGNEGWDLPSYPGGFDEVIGVGSTTSNASTRSSFSNYGSWVDVGAPGSGVWSTDKGSSFSPKSGTSMATPFVAAAAALLLQKCGYTGPTTTDTVLTKLQLAASPVVSNGSPGLGGAKHLQVGAALAQPC